MLNNSQRGFLRDIFLISFGCMSKDSFFAEYLSSESDFIEIFMQNLASQLETLPIAIAYNHATPEQFNVMEQLESNYNCMIADQFREFIATCQFFKDILSHIHNEKEEERNNNNASMMEDRGLTPNSYKAMFLREDLMFKKHVKESFSLAFFKLILRDII